MTQCGDFPGLPSLADPISSVLRVDRSLDTPLTLARLSIKHYTTYVSIKRKHTLEQGNSITTMCARSMRGYSNAL